MLLAQTTDHVRFALLFAENVNYGYRRKPVGHETDRVRTRRRRIGTHDCVGIAGWTGHVASTIQSFKPEWWASLAVAVVHALVFIGSIGADWVRVSAERYAGQLLRACDSLEGGGK